MHPIQLTPVGEISSDLKSLEDCPLQGDEGAPEATIIIHEPYREALKGIEKGKKIMLLTWLHAADRSVLQCYPRNEKTAPHTGVFATRSPDRPNPIGYHEVTVTDIGNNGTIKVYPLEALHKTPVLDIKPIL